MPRRTATLLSLLLCLATLALWTRSQWTFTRLSYTRPLLDSDATRQRRFMLLSWRDVVGFSIETEAFNAVDAAAAEKLRKDLPREQRFRIYEQNGISTTEDLESDVAAHHGFYYRSPQASRTFTLQGSVVYPIGAAQYWATSQSWRSFFLPWWFFALAFAILPLLTLAQRLRSLTRRRAGQCASCGYNMTGNVTGACPECGSPHHRTTVYTIKI